MGTRLPATRVSRRHVLAGAAGTAGAWIAPSIVTLDRVAAATGSCGVAATRVDWSDFAPTTTMPTSVTANDGTVVSFTMTGNTNLLYPGYVGNIRSGQRGGMTDYMAVGMAGAANGAGVTLSMSFSRAVQVCFLLLDVDRWRPGWEDSVEVSAFLGGASVPVTENDLVALGNSASVFPPNLARGQNNANNSDDNANVEFSAPQPVDRVELFYYDQTAATAVQVIGIHDLRWC